MALRSGRIVQAMAQSWPEAQRFLRQYGTISGGQPKYAVTCPGQGSSGGGLLAPFKKFQHHFQQLLEAVDEQLQENFSKHLIDHGAHEEWMGRTSNSQPAILTTTYVIHEILRKEYGIDLSQHAAIKYMLGHSLGQYTAMALTGVIDLAPAVSLVRKRGLLMERIAESRDYDLIAVLFRSSAYDEVLLACQKANVLANINSYDQLVLSGTRAHIDETIRAINSPKKKILKKVSLAQKVPFHNEVLRPIEAELGSFAPVPREGSKPIIANLTGSVETRDILSSSIQSISRPVRWTESVEYALQHDATSFINLGPDTVLQNINTKFTPNNVSISDPYAMDQFARSFSSSTDGA
ncbi:Piso0_002729 [Millerozyma farinosa CBS 7064]|uniref:[acyl-carrier-protein] S-malonyltransferase n=1 Tax=Pichia sorbitophila (strain ATCC MYA-4447 / BCRC 22081 / CBS 7064 / NBRC 10061 / NRRL Y-12695) TaxID=559304 RepID=G8YDC8_PICSO|nr:Piso0_002729 [Millerozyma farinosa CBS 7064]